MARRKTTSLIDQFRAEADKFGAQTGEAKERRARAFADFPYFCKTYLGHYFTLPIAPWQQQVIDAMLNEQFFALHAPREFGKSVLTGIGFPLWAIVTGRVRFQVHVGANLTLASGNIMAIRDELESNELLLSDFGPQKPEFSESKIWSQTMLVTKDRCAIVAKGAGSALRGLRYREFRPELVVLDDIEDDETVENPEQRDKLWKWFKRVVLFLGRKARVFWIGTVLHIDSCLNRLLNGAMRRFKTQRFKGLQDDGTSLWEELVPVERLRQMQEDDPVTFSTEIQGEPQSEEAALFKMKDVHYYEPSEIEGKQFDFYSFCDPSLGETSKADFTAIVTIAVEKKSGIVYVIDPFIERISRVQLIERIFQVDEKYKPRQIGVETVGFQKVLKEWIEEKSRERRRYLPIKEVDQKGISKDVRIERLSPPYERGIIRFPKKGAERLLSQLWSYPKGHDDGPDALEGAMSLAGIYRAGVTGFRSRESLWQQLRAF